MMEDGLRRLSAVSEDGIRRTYKRDPAHRIFVNRNLRMEKIKFFGFDMDHTLAVYRSPDLEIITFDMVVERMINIGYPEDLRSFKYKPLFPVRGLWFDHLYGNLLKVDGFGNILFGVHGFRFMKPSEIEDFYPNKFLHLSDSRVYVLNTLFNLPETYLVACLVDYFDNNPQYVRVDDKTGVKSGEVFMSYRSIFQDIRSAVDWVHFDSDMKNIILNNLDKYVVKDARIKQLLLQIKNSGKQSFLLTNSDYAYTNGLMEYMIGKDWTSYFNITVVNAHKPKWFAEGTVFREVNTESGVLKIGIHTGPLKQGEVYSGGSCDAFRRLVKARGKDVLYIGDHIFGDVLRSKKARGWRTFLVIPELTQELMVWTERKPLFERLNTLECLLADAYKDLDSNAKEKPVITTIMEAIKSLSNEMDSEYGILGSLFRSGSRTTFFASQVERYADVYAASCYNLVHYPLFYFFRAPMTLMPHESTVDHDAIMQPTPAAHFFHWQNSIGQQVRDLKTQATPFCHEEEEEEATSNSDTEGEKRDMSVSDDVPVQLNNADVVHIAPVHEDKNISAE
ncbi:Cytosolic purine 5'-nucleotidase [Toxocara canis]|uniref:Cytosolic purine 5'-nucleotidase n=1 Tax=Toxocara canis TaxID=6265 RepID=A0A0B2VNL7_TOXCA|nr:Cytosolic purine 5'-nucleotidase [Toxocara canis]